MQHHFQYLKPMVAMMLEEERPSFWLDRAADSADYAIVGPTDGRTQVLNARVAPYTAVCHVERDFGDSRFSGCSGFLVAPNVVVTAGHCVFSALRRRLGHRASPLRFRITPGRNGAAAPFGTYTARRFFAPRRFVQNSDRESDYGIVVLDRSVPSGVRPFPLLAPSSAQVADIRAHRLLHIAGYPGDKPAGTMWEHAERLDQATPRSLLYSVDTCPGHSGSAVWCQLQRGGPGTVIAVHVAGPTPHLRGAWGCRPGVPVAPAGMFNRGIKLTPTIIRQIQSISNSFADSELVRLSS